MLGELDGEQVTVQNGRYGPYVKRGTDSRSLATEEEMFTVTLAEAKELLAQPKPRGRGAASAAPPLRELGADPATGKPMVIKDGRFGPYVTDGETNASLRKGDEVASITRPARGRTARRPARRRPRAPGQAHDDGQDRDDREEGGAEDGHGQGVIGHGEEGRQQHARRTKQKESKISFKNPRWGQGPLSVPLTP